MRLKSRKKNETFGKNRKCIICGATLSTYNQRKKCFCHDYPKDYRPNLSPWNSNGSSWNGRKRYIIDARY